MKTFLLTHLMRGATVYSFSWRYSFEFLLTHLMRGATHRVPQLILRSNFYSRTSCEARRYSDLCVFSLVAISTHAPHARRDAFGISKKYHVVHFYSRTSCEARRQLWFDTAAHGNFYSRTSCEARHVGGN